MNKKVKVIFIPGNGGSGENLLGEEHQNWWPWLKIELERLEIKVIAKDWPDPELGRAKYWLPHLKKLGVNENTILIGWSTGAIAALRYAEKNKILGSILVGAYYSDLGEEAEKLSGYFDNPWQWEQIKNNQKWIVQFHSTDDPFIPTEEARFIKDKLNTAYFEFKDQQHFGYPNPKLDFPEILDIIRQKLSSK